MNKFEVRFHNHHDHDHDHDHGHSHHGHHHSHGHSHHHGDHDHNHDHDDVNVIENKEEKTLRVLLAHWVNHNVSHEESFKEWAEKSRNMGKEEVAIHIEKAIEFIDKANEMLIEAKKHM